MKEISQRTRDDFMYFDECRAKALMPTIEEVKISREKEIEVMYKKVEKILDQQYNMTIDPLTTGQTNRSNIYMQYFQKNEDRFGKLLGTDNAYADLRQYAISRSTEFASDQLFGFCELVLQIDGVPFIDSL